VPKVTKINLRVREEEKRRRRERRKSNKEENKTDGEVNK
jgi:hypothetical protein